jgi:hypothetical protein
MPDGPFDAIEGAWRGTARTWVQPGELTDESPFEATVRPAAAGAAVIIEYESSMQGAPLEGTLLIADAPAEGAGRAIAWVDSFHSPALMTLEPTEATTPSAGLIASVEGTYSAGDDGPPWGWRIEIAVEDGATTLAIRHHNIVPGHDPYLGVEWLATRSS